MRQMVNKYTTCIMLEDSPVGAEGTLLLAGSCPVFYRKYLQVAEVQRGRITLRAQILDYLLKQKN